MANNNVPLEKILLQLDLSKGINEMASPEVGGDQSKLVTTMDNLVQKQEGSWVPRDGITQVGATADDNGNSIGAPLAGVRIQQGLGLIANRGEYYNYSEASGNFRRAGRVSEFSVTGNLIASSAAAAEKQDIGQRILSCASNSEYDVVVYEGTRTSSAQVPMMVVYDRAAGVEVARYNLQGAMSNLSATFLPNVRVCFVADRYFHAFMQSSDVGKLQHLIHDTNSAWPAAVGSFTVDSDVTGDNLYIVDIISASDRAIAVCAGPLATDTTIASVDNAGAFIEKKTIATLVPYSGALDGVATPLVWVIGKDTTTNRFEVYAAPYNNLTSSSYAWVDASVTAEPCGLAVTPAGALRVVSAGELQTFGLSTCPRIDMWTTSAPADTALTATANFFGWIAYSNPWYQPETAKTYVHLSKFLATTENLGAHVVACVDDITTVKDPMGTTNDAVDNDYDTLRLAATIEPMLGLVPKHAFLNGTTYDTGVGNRQRYIPRASDEVQVVCPYRSVARSIAISSLTLKALDKTVYNSAQFGTSTYVSGGYISQHDNYSPHESTFVDMPVLDVKDTGNAGNLNGSYNYVAVFRGVGTGGELSWSRTAGPMSTTVANKKVHLHVQPPAITCWESGAAGDTQIVVDVYRTVSGGTQYFLCASSQSDLVYSGTDVQQLTVASHTAGTMYAVDDNLSDANLSNNALMHRQPGTDNAPLDRYPPPASNIVKRHKDRLFTTDPYGQRVYYSSFFVESESAWFNPALSFQCHGGSGPITSIESMDGRLFIFKKDAVFVVDGDGPPENGGNGTEFSPPGRLAVEFGCVSPRSSIVVPSGILYRSNRGFELLNRSLQNEYVGGRVKLKAGAYPTTLGVCLDPDYSSSRVRWLLSDDSTTREFVYDLSLDCWSTSTFTTTTMRHILTADIGGESVVYLNASKVFQNDPESSLEDGTTFMPWTVETGFIRPAGPQGRHRLHGVNVLGKRRAYHNLTVSLAFDYSDTYTQTATWEPDVLSQDLSQVRLNSETGQPISFRVKIEGDAPSDPVTYPVTTGKGMDLLGVLFEVAPKKGPQQLWSDLKA